MRLRNGFGLSLGVVLSLVFAGPTFAQPAVEVGDTGVTATGVTPGAHLFWLAFAREREGWFSRVLHWEGADSTADAAGQTVLQLGRSVPVKAIFVAVDMATGAFGASSPAAYPWATEVPFPAAGVSLAADRTSVVSLQDQHEELEVLVVRPKAGAWRGTIRHDDSASDAEPGVLVTFAGLTPWGSSPPSPGALHPGDVIVAIDPNTIEYFAHQLAAGR